MIAGHVTYRHSSASRQTDRSSLSTSSSTRGGRKFGPHRDDAAFGYAISNTLGYPREQCGLVLEGGSVSTDGAGCALIVEGTVLNSDRNPGLSRRDAERILESALGV